MPPTVEGIITIGLKTSSLCVDLEGPDRFDPKLFDQQFAKVGESTDYDPSTLRAKFVIVGSKMVIFSHQENHADAHYDMSHEPSATAEIYGGALVCAGMIKLNLGSTTNRNIWGDSSSLSERGRLTLLASNKYKYGTLEPILGEYFAFA